MKNEIPKLKGKALINYIIDLFMISDDMEEAVKEPKVRQVYGLFFKSFLIILLYWIVIKLFFISYIKNSMLMTYYIRISIIIIFIYLVILMLVIATKHYKYLFLTGKELSIDSIITFYMAFVIFFAMLYGNIYSLMPSLFTINNPIWYPTQFFSDISYNIVLQVLDFIIYSACIIFPIHYARIESNSMIVSSLNVLEVLIGIALISLFISTFVQKTSK